MLILPISARRVCVTAGSLAGAATLLFIFYVLIGWRLARQRLKNLGHKAPLVAYKLPFGTPYTEQTTPSKPHGLIPDLGIDLFAKATNRLIKNDFFNWSRELLDVPGRTVSLKMLGAEVLMTDDTDNIRTILSTRVSASKS